MLLLFCVPKTIVRGVAHYLVEKDDQNAHIVRSCVLALMLYCPSSTPTATAVADRQ
jgi:hypothetical protein